MPKLTQLCSELTQTKVRGASQAMLYATGMTEEDMDKPQVGICSVWYEGSTFYFIANGDRCLYGYMAFDRQHMSSFIVVPLVESLPFFC